MSSAHIDQQATEYLDGSISTALKQKVKSHIIFCNACRQYLTQIDANIQVLKSLQKVVPPKNLKAAVLASLAEKPGENSAATDESASAASGFVWPIKTIGVLFGVLIVAGVFIVRRSADKTTTPVAATPEKQTPAPAAVPVEKPVTAPVAAPAKSVSLIENDSVKKPPVKVPAPAPVAVTAPVPATPKIVPMTVLAGGSSAITDERTLVISNEKAFKELWAEHTKNQRTAPPCPDVNFAENDVVAIFGGRQPNAGYSIKIKKVQDTSWEGRPARVVYYWVQKPGSGAITATVISQPFHLQSVQRLNGKTYFKKLIP